MIHFCVTFTVLQIETTIGKIYYKIFTINVFVIF
jgi:hypothetical protein